MLKLIRRLSYLLRHRRRAAELAEEMAFHRELAERRGGEAGGRILGNVTLAREDARAVWIWPWLESVGQDLRYAVRTLVREPGVLLLAVGTLGCAVGLNTSLFTVFNAAILRPWPVHEPARVLSLSPWLPLAEYEYLAAHARTVAGMAAARCLDGNITGCGLTLDGREVTADFVTGEYFRVLGVGMLRGSGFPPEAGRLAVPTPVAVISSDAWHTRFSDDPAIVGRQVRLDGVPFTIVGVVDRRFAGTSLERREVWVPLNAVPLLRPDHVFDNRRREAAIVVRLADGVDASDARAELDVLHHQFVPGRREPVESLTLTPTSVLREGQRRALYRIFGLVLAALLLVLLLACANVGNLLVARGAARRAEIAVRVAIGASRVRVIRQLMTESVIVAGAAAIAGVVIAWNLPAVVLVRLGGLPSFDLRPDALVLTFTVALASFACLAFGLAPAVFAVDRCGAPDSSPRVRAGRGFPLSAVLLAVQVAVSVVLLVNAALLIRGARSMAALDVGYDIEAADVVSFDLPRSLSTDRRRAFARQVLQDGERAAGVPAGFASVAPFGETDKMWTSFRLPGEEATSDRDRDRDILFVEASAGYFDVLRLPFVAGRPFAAGDTGSVIVNEAMARHVWPGRDPLGGSLVVEGTERRVVGVVANARIYAGSVSLIWPTVYVPIGTRVVPEMLIPRGAPGAADAIATFAAGVEPQARVNVSPLARSRDRLIAESQAAPWMAGQLALFAIVLAATGVFGVFACSVAERRYEIGVRLALGARRAHVVSLVVGRSARALIVGLAAGTLAAAAVSRLLGRFLYGLSPLDATAYAATAFILAIAGLAATWIPTRRAARIDPTAALK